MNIYKPIRIFKDFPIEIECIHGYTFAYGNFLLVGTKKGTLLHYEIVLADDSKFDAKLLRSNSTFSKKSITQVCGIPELNIVISLSDGLISVHNLDNIQEQCKLTIDKAKGTLMFIIDLQMLKTNKDNQYALKLCAVMKYKISFFYLKENKFHQMNNTELILNDIPKAVAWSKETVYVGFRYEYAKANLGGKMKKLFPVGSKYVEPFVECLSNNRFVLGKDENTYFFNDKGEAVLKYPLNWSKNLIGMVDDLIYLVGLTPNSTIEIKTIEPKLHIQTIHLFGGNSKFKHLTKCLNNNGLIYVCSKSELFALVLDDFKKQISQFIEKDYFETATNLAIIYKEDLKQQDNKQIDYIKCLQAFNYFRKMRFKEAIKIYLELKIDPSIVIGLYPDLLPDEFCNKLEYSSQLSDLKGDNLDNAIAELIEYLIEIRHQLKNSDFKIKNLNVKDLFKKDVQTEAIINTNPDKLNQILDTTLLKCYLKTNDAYVVPLLCQPTNHCHLEESEKALKNCNKYKELIILYKSKNLHRKSLELLKKIHEQLKINHNPIKLTKPHIRTKEYLQNLGRDNIDLIFEFAKWVLKEYKEVGLEIFIGDSQKLLPRNKVLDYLSSIDKDLVIPYLEHVIYVWKDKDNNFHDILANAYRDKILILIKEYKLNLNKNDKLTRADEEPDQLGVLRKKLIKFLKKSNYYTAEKLTFVFSNDNLWEEKAIVLGKIGKHQEAIKIYVNTLNDTNKAEEYCESVYNRDLPNNCEVFFYLLKLYLRNSSLNLDNSNSLEFTNKNEKDIKPNLKLALRLLEKHATKMDPIAVLNELPEQIPINLISTFLINAIKNLIHRKNEAQIYCNLLYSHLMKKQKVNLHRDKVLIDEFSLCSCCNKRIGRSAFIRYPNKCLIHYSCKDEYKKTLDM